MKTLLLTPSDLARIVDHVGLDTVMDELIEQLATAFASFDEARTEIPVRTGFHYADPAPGLLEWMPLMRRGESVLVKLVGYHPENGTRNGLPTILSTMSLFDPATGHLVAQMDGTLPTALRTGAASAVASRILASPSSQRLGLIGCGAQSVTQLHALSRSFELSEVLIHDSDPAALASFAARVEAFVDPSLAIRALPVQQVVEAADILCLATSVEVGAGPVFDDRDTRPWLHVNAIGSDFPGKIEVPVRLLRRSFVAPDCLEQARFEGECQQLAPDEIDASLVELARDPKAFAEHQSRRTVFDSTGWALEDLVAANLVLHYAAELRLGSQIEIESVSSDPRDPYAPLRAGLCSADDASSDS